MLVSSLIKACKVASVGLFSALTLLPVLGAVTLTVGALSWDALLSRHARAALTRRWAQTQPIMIARLHQSEALQYGQVWATHSGLICGTVYGRHSFSGLTAMTPFFVKDGRPTFQADAKFDDFTPSWRECVADEWLVLRAGSMRAGYCGTRAQKRRCAESAYF